MWELVEEVRKILNDHDLWPEEIWDEVCEDKVRNELKVLKYEIEGDWKHDHLYSTCLVGDYLDAKGIKYTHIENVTYQDGSDWYKAVHVYILKEGAELWGACIKDATI